MSRPIDKAAVQLLRTAALIKFGPIAGGVFLTGAAIAAASIGGEELGKSIGSAAASLLTGKSAELFNKVFSDPSRNGDLEISMKAAARLALDHLATHAPAGYEEWFEDWRHHLDRTPPDALFSGTGDVNPLALHYDDATFIDLWWAHMEPTLVRWRAAANAGFQQLHLAAPARLPSDLGAYLRQSLPKTLQHAHDQVLRDPAMTHSWIASQQQFQHRVLNALESLAGPPTPPPPLWRIPEPTRHFRPRPAIDAQIDAALRHGRATALTALHGLPGIGKTEMALHFAATCRDAYQCGVWLPAETEPGLITALAALAPDLGLPPLPDQPRQAEAVLRAISAQEPWLVIFDNVETEAAIAPWTRRLTGRGHIVISSRNEAWDAVATPVPITTWTPDEAADFLLDRTGQSDRPAALALARDLDGLILAVDHAAAYLKALGTLSIADYHRTWRQRLAKAPKSHHYTQSVAAAIGLSLDRVESENPAASSLLRIFAWLSPERIPHHELLTAGAEALPEELRTALADPESWAELIEGLTRYSLVTREIKEGLLTGYFVHRVVQQLVRERPHARDSYPDACDLVNAAVPTDPVEPESWPACAALLPHARTLRADCTAQTASPALVMLINSIGTYTQEQGMYLETLDLRKVVLAAALHNLGSEHPVIATLRSNLAIVLKHLGDFSAAHQQFQLAIAAALKYLSPNHPTIATLRSNLAAVLRDLGEPLAARDQIQLAINATLSRVDSSDLQVARRRFTYASILRDIGDLSAAREQAQLALSACLSILGPNHPEVANGRSNLALILQDLMELSAARDQIKLALDAEIQVRGPNHPYVAVRRSNFAMILRELGDPHAAREQIQLALDDDLQNLGPNHPGVATRRTNLAMILRDLGDLISAREQGQLALDANLQNLGPNHPTVAIYRNNLALIHLAQGHPHLALPEIDEALRISRAALPPDNPRIQMAEATRRDILAAL